MWYPGCGPCESQFPYLRAASDRFGQTDLTILGFSHGYPREGRLWDISPTSPPEWIEAEPQSVRRLLVDWFQITSNPTLILLDREGRVSVLDAGRMASGPSRETSYSERSTESSVDHRDVNASV